MEALQALGIWSIWVDNQGDGLPRGSRVVPDRIIISLVELIPIAKGVQDPRENA